MEDIQVFDFHVKSRINDYDVYFSDNIKEILLKEIKDGDFIIIDSKVRAIYGEIFNEILSSHNYFEIDANETVKSYEGTIPVIDFLIRNGFKKKNRLIAVGGGITQDITSFIASVMYRGVDWIFIPTSLLAQGDSCIGSKTSINFREFKNQIGGFYPPKKIFINIQFLNSISEVDFKSGLGELCHYIILSSKKDFDLVANNYDTILKDRSKLKSVISRSLQIKKVFIEQDEFDEGIRQLLNYGHSFGHAIESITGFKIPHGIAVAFGMDIANYISVEYGMLDSLKRQEIRSLLSKIWHGFDLKSLNTKALLNALSKDKKNVDNKLGLILLNDFGDGEKKLILPDDKFIGYLEKYLNKEL